LKAGDEIVVPTGDGNESVHARLIAACHRKTDVATLDALLGDFRRAAKQILTGTRPQAAAIEKLRANGAHAPGQLPAWASGKTIAPEEPGDVRTVFATADLPSPDLRVIYEIASTLRNVHRTVGRLVSALRSRRDEMALRRLKDLVGDVAEELIEEFAVYRVESVERPTDIAGYMSGRIT
ncbi:MAG: hypothetical protein JO337_06335, partial [Acidimicrobiales bacterium]|nr:hypothetical protein [Acidimicrobiales bacterium]